MLCGRPKPDPQTDPRVARRVFRPLDGVLVHLADLRDPYLTWLALLAFTYRDILQRRRMMVLVPLDLQGSLIQCGLPHDDPFTHRAVAIRMDLGLARSRAQWGLAFRDDLFDPYHTLFILGTVLAILDRDRMFCLVPLDL